MDALRKQALALWPGLATQMGVDPGDFTASPLAGRADRIARMVALRLSGPRELVLKLQDFPRDPDAFMAQVEALQSAHDACPEAVPGVYAVDFDAQALVMAYANARPLAALLRDAPRAEHAALMRRAGAWLDRWHRATLGKPRVFRPRYTMEYLRTMTEEIRAGRRQVQEPDRFLSCAEALLESQPAYEGQETQAARSHGDLHLGNLLVGEHVWGIDMLPAKVVPVGHDIGRLLANYATMFGQGRLLDDAIGAAFFDGYRLVGPDDPSVRLMLRHRTLVEWWSLPPDPQDRTRSQALRWQGIAALQDALQAPDR